MHPARARTGFALLVRDERGAIAVLGLFMAVFLTAAAYYVVGIGEAVLYRERMQDAADTAAFSAAVLHARGMNLIALVNMTMAALLAVLVALKLVELVMTVAIAIIAVASFFGASGLAGAVPQIAQYRSQVQRVHDRLRPDIHRMLETLHATNRGIRAVVPLAAAARGMRIAGSYASSPVQLAAVVPARRELPTEDGTFDELCDAASGYVGDLTAFAALHPVPDAIRGAVGDAIAELVSAGSDWFCGPHGAPPTARVTQHVHHPKLPSMRACEEMAPGQPGYDAARHDAACAQADRDKAASNPDRETGACGPGCDPALYEERSQLARRACAPRTGRDRLQGFAWQERRFTRSYELHEGQWLRVPDPTDAGPVDRFRETRARPCGHRNAEVGRAWNEQLRGDDGEIVPLCSRETVLSGGEQSGRKTVEHVQVLHLFGCRERIVRDYAPEGDPGVWPEGGEGAARDKVPQRLLEGVELGGEPFQVRALVLGREPPGLPRRVLEVATYGQPPGAQAAAAGVLAGLGRFAVAQAEYFFAAERPEAYDPAAALWSMRWKARLRRFRWPEPDERAPDAPPLGQLQDLVALSCDHAGGPPEENGSCAALDPLLDAIVH